MHTGKLKKTKAGRKRQHRKYLRSEENKLKETIGLKNGEEESSSGRSGEDCNETGRNEKANKEVEANREPRMLQVAPIEMNATINNTRNELLTSEQFKELMKATAASAAKETISALQKERQCCKIM